MSREAPEGLADESERRAREDDLTAAARLSTAWSGDAEARHDTLTRALLGPYVEVLSALEIPPDRLHRPGHCPFCGGAPIVAFRRSPPESHGAERALVCALCGRSWPINRIRCPACAEENPEKLPSFCDDRHLGARIEACETCRRYVKSIDLTLDARPIPEVDDLLSISLDLWAQEQGYVRLEPGLAGL